MGFMMEKKQRNKVVSHVITDERGEYPGYHPQQFLRKVRGPATGSTSKQVLSNAASSRPSLDSELSAKDKVQLTAKINRVLHDWLRIIPYA